MNEQNTPQPRTFEERLRAGRFVMTVEVTPPLSCDPEDLLRKAVPLDPWGRPYLYTQPGNHGDFDLLSYGRDGRPGGTGEDADITNW